MRASVIIPVLDAAGTLPDQLAGLAAQTCAGAWEVIVADGGSTDGSAGIARAFSGRLPSLRVVDASARRGTGYGRNRGAAAARGELLLYCDADDVAAPRWVEAMAEALDRCELAGGAFDLGALNDAGAPTPAWCADLARRELPHALGFLPYAPSGNFAIRAAVLRDLGGWNEGYGYGGEDVELCWRAQLAGHRLGFAPGAVVRYRIKRRLRSVMRQRFAFGRADARLYREFRARGVPEPKHSEVLGYWRDLWTTAPDLRDPRERREWLAEAAFRCGRLWGSLREGVCYG